MKPLPKPRRIFEDNIKNDVKTRSVRVWTGFK
jgi:hypothetical protein